MSELETPGDVGLTVEESPSNHDLQALRVGLTEHARELIDRPGFRPLAIFAHDRDGQLTGGVYGLLNWTWLDVSLLWVAVPLRGLGLGSKLLLRLEAEALTAGCQRAHVETFSYQARSFYERHGYEIFARLPDYPPGHQKIFLKKRLAPVTP